MVGALVIGLGAALAAFLGRAGLVAFRNSRGSSGALTRFYKGGFEQAMSRREASLILELKEATMTKEKVRTNHRRLMIINHPDRGGSPYLAQKINEAKALLDKQI